MRTSSPASSSDCRATFSALRAATRSQYAFFASASVRTTVSRNRVSEISRFRFETINCCLAESMARSRSSGWENASVSRDASAGLKFVKRLVVVVRDPSHVTL